MDDDDVTSRVCLSNQMEQDSALDCASRNGWTYRERRIKTGDVNGKANERKRRSERGRAKNDVGRYFFGERIGIYNFKLFTIINHNSLTRIFTKKYSYLNWSHPVW